jgi:hypothetical protein
MVAKRVARAQYFAIRRSVMMYKETSDLRSVLKIAAWAVKFRMVEGGMVPSSARARTKRQKEKWGWMSTRSESRRDWMRRVI